MLEKIISHLQLLPAEATCLIMLVVTGMGCLILFRLFGLLGLFCFISISVLAANMQVLTAAKFSFFDDPIAMGTIVFSGTYMTINIMTEHYGKAIARKGVWVGFASMLLIVILMTVTLGWPALKMGGDYTRFDEGHHAIATLFMPAPAIFLSSFIAYIVSQYNDIWIFNVVRTITSGRMLWLRTNVATVISAFIDTSIFSFLAWWLFAKEPLNIETIWFTYILGSYVFRVLLSFLNTPFVYLSYYFKPRTEEVLSYA